VNLCLVEPGSRLSDSELVQRLAAAGADPNLIHKADRKVIEALLDESVQESEQKAIRV